MIPKIIYFTWISPKPLPEQFSKYIETWKKVMPDYEIIQIGLDNINKEIPFVKKCLDAGKYGMAGHYERVRMLYETGGIYFDADIEAVKSFDDLLQNSFFLGKEDEQVVNNAVIGSVAKHDFLKRCMNYMDAFDINVSEPELNTGPWMFTRIAHEYEQQTQNKLMIYPPRWFYPYSYKEKFYPECVTKDTYTIHHWAKTWG